MRGLLVGGLAALLGGVACVFHAAGGAGDPAVLTAAALEQHVRTLAADELRGRDTASAGSGRAAEYLAGVLSRAGLEPAGDDGSFLQTLDLRSVSFAGPPGLELLDAQGRATALAFGAEFEHLRGGALDAELEVVVARSAGELDVSPRSDAALYLDTGPWQARRWLEQAGMPGGRGWGLLLLAGPTELGAERSDAPSGLAIDGEPTMLRLRASAREAVRDGPAARVRVASRLRETRPAQNVVGLLRGVGTDERPELADECLVFTAHYDHIGVAAAASDAPGSPYDEAAASGELDLIYNGADDDASGVAAVLELARAFARDGPPARTLVFLLVTGEERGLLGTRHYLEHPVVPLERTVVNINFEMVGRPDELVGGPGRLWLTGYERTNLGPAWQAAGLAIGPDPRPEENFYERSDNIAFVMRGIVGQTLSSFNLHEDYHTVRDEADRLDYAHMREAVEAAYAACRLLADGTLDPHWAEVDAPEGEERRAR
jgi:hypothetical protein